MTEPVFRSQGFDFLGWSAVVPATVPANNLTLTADWAPSDNTTYSVRYYLQNANGDGYTLAQIDYLNGETGRTVRADEKSFVGFALFRPLPTAEISADGSTVLSVYYDRLSYSAVYQSNGGTPCADKAARYGAVVVHPITTRQGYGFVGWYTDEALLNPFDGIMPVDGIVLYAKWEAGSVGYVVRHLQQNTGDDNYTQESSQNLTANADSVVSPDVKTYTGFNSPEKKTVTVSPDGTLVVEYRYTRKTYTLTFIKENGEADSVATVRYGAAITAPTISRTGYAFAGWSETVPETMPASNSTYTAVWNIRSFTISFNTDGGSAVNSITGTYGSAVTAPADPMRLGYTFTGWSAAVPSTIPAGNITLIARWSRDIYSIDYDLASGTATGSNPDSFHVESGVISVSNPTRTGYTFAGWTGTGLSSATKSLTIPTGSTGNRSYTATWTENTYTIKFQIYGQGATGSTAQMSMNYTTSAALTANGFARTGYTFAGWSTAAGVAKAYNAGQTVSRLTATNGGTVTLYPVWTANTYTVTYNGNGVIANQTITCTYDVSYTAPAKSVNGYTFLGWSTGPSDLVNFKAGASFSNLATSGNYTLYARWQVNDYYSHSMAGQTKNFGRGDDNLKIHYMFGVEGGNTENSNRMVINIPSISHDVLIDNRYTVAAIHITGYVERSSGVMGIFTLMTLHEINGAWTNNYLDMQVDNKKNFDITVRVPILSVDGFCVIFESGMKNTHVDLSNYKIEFTFI